MSDPPRRPVFAFGAFRLDPAEQRLTLDGVAVPLTPKAFELLLFLVEHPGHLLRKDELLAAAWPGTFVEEAVLSVNMSAIRKALSTDPTGAAWIETVPRRGYRFNAPVRQIDGGTGTSAPSGAEVVGVGGPAGSTSAARGRRRMRVVWAVMSITLVLTVAFVQLSRPRPRPAVAASSIAVLPLQSLSSDPDQEYFADALTELLITDLGQIPALRVVSRQSILQYRDSRKPLPAIARELNVEYLAEGTVSRDGDRVRVTAQLIHGASDRHVWSMSYERDLPGAFALQNEVTESIAREIGLKLAPAPARSVGATTIPAEAYEAYLRGNYLLDQGQTGAAIEQLRRAVVLHPRFAAAYARIASSYFGPGFYGGMRPSEAWPNMREAALKALDIDSTNAEAHAALADVKLHYDWDWADAEREFQRSLQLNPSDSGVRHFYAHYLLTVGRDRESLAQMDRAFEIDPVGAGTAT